MFIEWALFQLYIVIIMKMFSTFSSVQFNGEGRGKGGSKATFYVDPKVSGEEGRR